MSKNKLNDLNNHLFAQIERLSDETLETEKLIIEIARSRAVAEISREIVGNAHLMLKAQVAIDHSVSGSCKLPPMLDIY